MPARPYPWQLIAAAAGTSLLAAGLAAWAGAELGVPVGFDIPLWTDAALDWRWGRAPTAPPLYPALAALGPIALTGRVISLVSACALPLASYALGRRLGASPGAAVLGAGVVALSPDLAIHASLFGPDTLAALVFTAWFGVLLGGAPAPLVALLTAMAVSAREPALLLLPVMALALGRATWAPLVAGLATSPVICLRWPSAWREAFPALHKFEPVAIDVVRGGRDDYLLGVTMATHGPLAAIEDACRGPYLERASLMGMAERVAFNAVHGLVAHVDLLLIAGLAAWGAHRAGKSRVAWLFLPLIGTVVAWSQRRHFLPWLGLEGALLALLFDRVRAARWAVPLLALLSTALVLPEAASWIEGRAASDASAAATGVAVREVSRPDDLLRVERGARLDPVLLATAERPLAPPGPLTGALRARTVVVGRSPGEDWISVYPGVFTWPYARECDRGELSGTVGFGLVPGDNGRGARVLGGCED